MRLARGPASRDTDGNMAASEWSEMGSRDMDCIGRVEMRLSEREYRKLGSFGIDGYVARVARLNGSEGINERIIGSKRLVGRRQVLLPPCRTTPEARVPASRRRIIPPAHVTA